MNHIRIDKLDVSDTGNVLYHKTEPNLDVPEKTEWRSQSLQASHDIFISLMQKRLWCIK